MRFYIYTIWFPTSRKYYIGQTNNLEKRMQEHLRSNNLVCKALWKYDDWQVSILHTCKIRDEANRIEIEEIRNLNSVAPNGYNLTHGGEGGIQCEEIKKKMSKNHADFKGVKNPNFGNRGKRNPLYGKKSPEHSERMQGNKHRQGCCMSEEAKMKISGDNSVSHRLDVKYKKLRTRLAKLEFELRNELKVDS